LKVAKINEINGMGKATITRILNFKICQDEFVADRVEDVKVLAEIFCSNDNPHAAKFSGTVYEDYREKILTFPITINDLPKEKKIYFVSYGDPNGKH